MRFPRVRRQSCTVRRPFLPGRYLVHRLRPGSGISLSMGCQPGRHWLGQLDRHDDLPRRAWPWPCLCLEEGSSRMGVMLSPGRNPNPTEEEVARAAGLVPGSAEEAKFLEMRKELDEKGFLVTTTEDLFTWARTGSL